METHVKAFRLFDLSQAGSSGRGFQLTDWERGHLEQCQECQMMFGVFARQIKARLPSLPANGEINQKDGWYKNVCCGIEIFVCAGAVFPDCRRHKNLPTIWKPRDDEAVARSA